MKQVLAAAVIGLAVALPAGASTPEETAYMEGLKQLHWIEAPASAPIAANAECAR